MDEGEGEPILLFGVVICLGLTLLGLGTLLTPGHKTGDLSWPDVAIVSGITVVLLVAWVLTVFHPERR